MAKKQAEKQPRKQGSEPGKTVDPLWFFKRIVKKGEDGQPEVDHVYLAAVFKVLREELGSADKALWAVLRLLENTTDTLRIYYRLVEWLDLADPAVVDRELPWVSEGMYGVATAIAPEVLGRCPNLGLPARPGDDPEGSLREIWTWFSSARSALQAKWMQEKQLIDLRNLVKQLEAMMKSQMPEAGGAGEDLTADETGEDLTADETAVYYRGERLPLSAGLVTDVMRKLVSKKGRVVRFQELDHRSIECEASEDLRQAIRNARNALKTAEAPYEIENVKGCGYVLKRTETLCN